MARTQRLAALTLAAALALAGCSGDDDAPGNLVDDVTDEQAVPCPEAGEILTEAHTEGCVRTVNGHSELMIYGAHRCVDGRALFANDGLYGFIGERAVEGGGDDPGFAAAYDDCTGG